MSVGIINGDLSRTKARYICHSVNCQGRMNSGLGEMAWEKFPEAFEKYKSRCEKGAYLGITQYVLSNNKFIVNMFVQLNSGCNGNKCVDLNALIGCLAEIHSAIPDGNVIAMPYKAGCDMDDEEWAVIYNMIDRELGQDYTIELWKQTTEV